MVDIIGCDRHPRPANHQRLFQTTTPPPLNPASSSTAQTHTPLTRHVCGQRQKKKNLRTMICPSSPAQHIIVHPCPLRLSANTANTRFSLYTSSIASMLSHTRTTEMAKVLSKREAKSKNPLSHPCFPTLHESCTPRANSSAPPSPPPPSVGRIRDTTATPPSTPCRAPSSPQGLSRPEITSS